MERVSTTSSGGSCTFVSENSILRALSRYFLRKKQGCRYNGISMNGVKPEQKAVAHDLCVRSPDENCGTRQDHLMTGGVRIVTGPEFFRIGLLDDI